MRRIRLAMALSLCSAPQLWAQTVKVNWQMGAPFASYKTYGWQDPKNPGLPFYGQWVKPDVIAQLNAKGLSPVAAGQTPDLIVTYHIQGQASMNQTSTTDGFDVGPGPWGGGWGWYGGWGGWGASNSEKGDAKQTQQRVQKLFKSYPPKSK